MAITEPGLYDGIPEEQYHADEALSSAGARELLPPSCPAIYHYRRSHPVFKDVFDFGSAAHKLVLGEGPAVKVVDAADWRTKAAQEQRDAARAAGFIPLLAHEWARAAAMAAAIQDHELAGELLSPLAGGKAELSGWWQDPETGVWCRFRLDWLAGHRTRFGQPIIVDYKSSTCAEPETFARKSVAEYRYDQQDAWYSDGYLALTGEQPAFLFLVQEKLPPYLISVVQLTEEDRQVGRERNRRALEVFRDCAEAGIWPGYSQDVELIAMPSWARSRGDDW